MVNTWELKKLIVFTTESGKSPQGLGFSLSPTEKKGIVSVSRTNGKISIPQLGEPKPSTVNLSEIYTRNHLENAMYVSKHIFGASQRKILVFILQLMMTKKLHHDALKLGSKFLLTSIPPFLAFSLNPLVSAFGLNLLVSAFSLNGFRLRRNAAAPLHDTCKLLLSTSPSLPKLPN